MMTPEQIAYVREWAKSGNEPRDWTDSVSLTLRELINRGVCEFAKPGGFCALSDVGLTIARFAEDLAIAREVLREVDFRTNGTSDQCPCCANDFYDKDHEPDCKLKRALGD